MMAPMPEDSWLRDQLATERTALANERTLLAYVRTTIALFAGGAAGIHFLDSSLVDVIGWLLIASGILVLLFGLRRFRQVSKLIGAMHRSAESTD
jgi:inner membrane protein YidH